jgi:hypothetical protein
MEQMSLALIHRTANDVVIDQRHSDGYFNATAMCKAAKKAFNDYKDKDTTKAFLAALSAKTGFPVFEGKQTLVEVRKGSPANGGGTWVHPKVALNLAQWASPEFAILVTDWIEDYWHIKNAPPAAANLPDYFNRYLINKPKIPTGYFSILQMTTMELAGPMQQLGYTQPPGMMMDVSVALHYNKHLRADLKLDTDSFEGYWHEWGTSRQPVLARLYPNALLEDFYAWFAAKYMVVHAPDYLGKKDKSALTFLNKMPVLAAPTKPAAKNLPWHSKAA